MVIEASEAGTTRAEFFTNVCLNLDKTGGAVWRGTMEGRNQRHFSSIWESFGVPRTRGWKNDAFSMSAADCCSSKVPAPSIYPAAGKEEQN